MLLVCIKYSTCDLICDLTSSFAVFQATTLVKINFHDKIVIENQKKGRKYGNQRNFYINLHLKDGLGMDIIDW